MHEQIIRKKVESRQRKIDVDTDWYTPAGNRRSAPIYVAYITNEYLGKEREIKGKTLSEIDFKVNECIAKWNEQEIRKRVAAAKKDAKEQAQAETVRLDQEAKSTLADMGKILEAVSFR